MAKIKKQEQSIEQRLEEAIVLYEKTPYKLPSNWCWTKLPYLAQIRTGKKDANHAKENGQYRFYTCSADYAMTDTYSFEGESVIVPGNGDIGLVFYYNGKFEAYQRTYIVNGFYGETKYLYYYFYYKWRDQNAYKQFGTAIPYIRMVNFEDFEIPLAPLEEQKRIVEVIEKQFAKLDESRDLIQKSLDSFNDRKSAILHKAFTGELTKKWRKSKDKIYNFQRKKFSEVAKIKSNLVDPADYLNMPHIAPDCIEKFTGKLMGYKSIKEDGVFSPKHRCYKNQIIYSKIRPNLSKLIISEFDCLCSADMYPIEANGNVKYLYYAMLSTEFLEQASSAGSRSVLPKINQKELSGLSINIPDLEEQEEVVRILDSIFEKEDKSKELIDLLDKIDVIKKAILSRAFRGELGTSNPADEPAIDLLRKILLSKIK